MRTGSTNNRTIERIVDPAGTRCIMPRKRVGNYICYGESGVEASCLAVAVLRTLRTISSERVERPDGTLVKCIRSLSISIRSVRYAIFRRLFFISFFILYL